MARPPKALATKLAEYLDRHGIAQAAFARRAGIPRQVLWHYVIGDRKPGLENAMAIAEATEGKVDLGYWRSFQPKPHVPGPPRSRRSRAA